MNGRVRRAHVVLNALLLNLAPTYRGAGISHYQQHLLSELAAHAEDYGVFLTALIADKRWHPPAALRIYRPRWPVQYPMVRILWEQVQQVRILKRLDGDLIHSLAFVGPQWGTPIPQVVTVHDLTFVRFPHTLPAWKARYLRWMTKRSAQRARRLIAVSESTRRDLLNWLHLPPDQVITVYNGVEPRFSPLPPRDVAAWRERKRLPSHFILYLGTLQPRKNLELLIRAYAQWQRQTLPAYRHIPLILAGAKGWYYEHLFHLVDTLGLSGQVYFPGFVPSEELPWWYNAATLFVYPSLFEGFGLPVLEAMACGTPVIAADASSLPEVVGEAGILLPPQDAEAWAKGIQTLLADPERRQGLGRQGRERARRFSWQRTAKETLSVYREILRSAHD